MRKPPCKINGIDCPKRHPGCHSGCPDYAEFDAEKQKERAQRMQERISSDPSPSKRSRSRHYEVQKMRGGYK